MQLQNGRDKIDVGDIILGTNMKKELLNSDDMTGILNMFCENGGKCIDTARSYNSGLSELLIGKWLKKSGMRYKIIVSTKAGHARNEYKIRLTKDEIEADLDTSLKALKTDYIDLFWIHRDAPNIMVEEIIDYLNYFVNTGKIRMFGASNWTYKRIQMANIYAKKTGQLGFSCSQLQWSVGVPNREAYIEHGMYCMNEKEYYNYLHSGFPVFAFSSQAKGYFYYIKNKEKIGNRQLLFDNEKNKNIYTKLQHIADSNKVSLTYPILSFILSSPLNAVPIVGYRRPENLIEYFNSIKFRLPIEEYQKLLEF